MVKEIRWRSEHGQTMAEYVLVLGVITLAIVATIGVLSGAINEAFERTVEIVETAM